MAETRENESGLWALTVGPAIWSAFFLAAYLASAIHCAKAESPFAGVAALRLGIGAGALVALCAIGLAGWRAWRRWREAGGEPPPHHHDSPESRRQFLALATLLLCGVSFVATIYVALPAAFIGSCR